MRLNNQDWKWRLIMTVIIILLCWNAILIYRVIQGPIESEIAVKQLEDSNLIYASSRAIVIQIIPRIISSIAILALFIIWVPFAIKRIYYQISKK